MSDSPGKTRYEKLAIAGALVLLMRVLVATAWQCDDAYITHRSAHNLLAGYGPVFNPGERVQAFTDPLWMAVSALCQGLSGEAYFSVIAMSIVLCVATGFVIATRIATDRLSGAIAVVAFSASMALMDFGASGLENPLLYLLVAIAVALPEDASPGVRTLLCSALALVRLDAAVLVAPAALLATWRAGRRAIPGVVLGMLPLVAWEAFSLVYYGSLVPNTALAKLNLALPGAELAGRGLGYVLDSLRRDPLTLALALGGAAVGLTARDTRGSSRPLAVGILAYLVYVVRVGGDFMAGRFLTPPAILGLALLARHAPRNDTARAAGVLALVAYGILLPHSRWLTDSGYGVGWPREDIVSPAGIADERSYYYPFTGLLRVLEHYDLIVAKQLPTPPYTGAKDGLAAAAADQRVIVQGEIGYLGFFAGPDRHVLDVWALADPLLARLPFQPSDDWRVGHYTRPVPDGYVESIETGENHITDPAIAALYDDVRLLTRGPLFTQARWAAIVRTGAGL